MNRLKKVVVAWVFGVALGAVLAALTACEIQAYGGAGLSSFYPDKVAGKEVGDPRKEAYGLPREPGGVSIGGHRHNWRPGEKPRKGGE